MAQEHKKSTCQRFKTGLDDKGKKTSAALTLEELYGKLENNQMHPRSNHCLPYFGDWCIRRPIIYCTKKTMTMI